MARRGRRWNRPAPARSGQDVVRVRAWVNPPSSSGASWLVEAIYRPLADPSRPERELDVRLPDDHPLQRRVAGVIRRLIEQYGDPATLEAMFPPKPVVKPDSAKVKPDTAKVKPDTTLR